MHFNEARKLKNEVDAIWRGTDKIERNNIDADESILKQYELLKDYGIISKKNKSNKLSKIWEKLDENVKLNEWIQKKDNEKLLKKQELHNQAQDRQDETDRRQSERLARKSKKEKASKLDEGEII